MRETISLTVAQAIVRFLSVQYSERDGQHHRLIDGFFGIFGHGNVAGIGQALLEDEIAGDGEMPYWTGRNEQGMVHAATGYARTRRRLSTLACTTSIGPGATNMVTGAALATINRIPVLLLPGDEFATRVSSPVLQELECPAGFDVTVNDVFRPVSKFFDRVDRPEQLPSILLGAMRVLTDPVETGAVTIACPQDVQAEAFDWPVELFARRTWHIPRPAPEPAVLDQAIALLLNAQRPLIVAGGGVIYSEAAEVLQKFAAATGIPVAETQSGKGSLPWDHPQAAGAIGATGSPAANALAAQADVVVGIGTRWTDFTTASKSLFAEEGVSFINLNIAGLDAHKLSGLALVSDAKVGIAQLATALEGWKVTEEYAEESAQSVARFTEVVDEAFAQQNSRDALVQSAVIGAVNKSASKNGVVICAAGSLPGDLHKLWRATDEDNYHVEYGFSCMGYEIAGGLGVAMADPNRIVHVMVGDGSYLMLAQELVTAVQESIPLVVVLVDNQGFASIGALSESVGSQRFGTRYRRRNPLSGRLDDELLRTDLAANAESLGLPVIRARTISELRGALDRARAHRHGPIVIHVETDPFVPAPESRSWWDVPVAETSQLESTKCARTDYVENKKSQRDHLSPTPSDAFDDSLGEPLEHRHHQVERR